MTAHAQTFATGCTHRSPSVSPARTLAEPPHGSGLGLALVGGGAGLGIGILAWALGAPAWVLIPGYLVVSPAVTLALALMQAGATGGDAPPPRRAADRRTARPVQPPSSVCSALR